MNNAPNPTAGAGDLTQLIEATLTDYKAVDIRLLDLRPYNGFADMMLLCTGTSTRHIASLSNQVIKTAKEHKCPVLGVEGQQHNEWVAIDLSVIVVHLMLAEIRDFYAIEKIWSG